MVVGESHPAGDVTFTKGMQLTQGPAGKEEPGEYTCQLLPLPPSKLLPNRRASLLGHRDKRWANLEGQIQSRQQINFSLKQLKYTELIRII